MTSPIPPSPSQIIRATDSEPIDTWPLSEAARIKLARTYGITVPGDVMNHVLHEAINAALKAMSLSATTPRVTRFQCGDAVLKTGGDYRYDGTVVAVFHKLGGAIRYVVEDERGLLFIFNEAALIPRQPDDGDAADLVKRLDGRLAYLEASDLAPPTPEKDKSLLRECRARLAALGAEGDSFASDNNDAHAEAILWKQRAEKAEADLASLRAALERLASAEAFVVSRAIDRPQDDELVARMEYAANSLKTQEPVK